MKERKSARLWKTVGVGAAAAGAVWVALWVVLSLAFPWKVAVSLMAVGPSGGLHGWQNVFCQSQEIAVGRMPVTLWGNEVQPVVKLHKDEGIMAASLSAPNGETRLLVCAGRALTDEDLTMIRRQWTGSD